MDNGMNDALASLEKSIFKNTGAIFETLDAAALKAELLGLDWLKPTLNNVAGHSYSMMRAVANVTGFLELAPGPAELALETIDFFTRVSMSQAVAEALAEEKGVSIRYELPETDCAVAVDTDKLALAFFNLLHNAISCSKPGDEVIVFGRIDRQRDSVSFTVTDRGPGIPADILPHVFEPYFTWSEKPDERASRLGLGLTVAKLSAEAHGGRLTLATSASGTAATFTLPRRLYRAGLKLRQGDNEAYPPADRFSRAYVGLADL